MIALLLVAGLLLTDGPPQAAIVESLQGSFVRIASLRALDAAVAAELQRRTKEPVADVGEPFEPTDVVTGDLPSRRFVLAGKSAPSPTSWVVCYEHGGRGYHYHIALLEVDAGDVRAIKAGQWLPTSKERKRAVTLARVLKALHDDEVQYDNHW
jgi:hypothetical protein